MRTVTIQLPYNVAHRLEVQAAKDDMRIEEAVSLLLTALVIRWEAKR